jgi:hypothetical protein
MSGEIEASLDELCRPLAGAVRAKYLADGRFRTMVRRQCGLPPLPGDGEAAISPKPTPKPLPSLSVQAWNLAKAAIRHVMDGGERVTEPAYRLRLEVCGACPSFRDDSRCAECGCFMREKAWWRTAECPLGKWPAPEAEPTPEPEKKCGCRG